MKIKCPSCGFENEKEVRFCENCEELLPNPYIKKKKNEGQFFKHTLNEEVKAETEGGKYKRLNLKYDKLLEKPDSNFNLIEKYRKELSKIENNWVNRNLKGIKLEKEGKIDKAIKLYEKNIEEEFDGSHPYTRLAIIYSKKGLLDDEIRVLKKAIWVFENVVYKQRGDRSQKLDKFKKRLEKANKKRL